MVLYIIAMNCLLKHETGDLFTKNNVTVMLKVLAEMSCLVSTPPVKNRIKLIFDFIIGHFCRVPSISDHLF